MLHSGGLAAILKLCTNPSDTVVMLTVSVLSRLLEDPGTHTTVVDGDKAALQRLLKLAATDNAQVHE